MHSGQMARVAKARPRGGGLRDAARVGYAVPRARGPRRARAVERMVSALRSSRTRRWVAAGCFLGWATGLGALPAAAAEPVECLIEPWRSVTVSAAIEGVVEMVAVDRGDRVKKGQVLARLEASVESASLRVARSRAKAQGNITAREARLEFADNNLARQSNLEERNIVSKSDMDEAVSTRRVAEAELKAAREEQEQAALEVRRTQAILERRTIRSPISGVVVERILSPGEYADPPQILTLAQVDPLRVEVFAPLSMLARIEPGMTAQVMPEQPIGGRYTATVTVVDRVIDAASGTFGVRLELPNPELTLPAGLSCSVEFDFTRLGSATPDPYGPFAE